MFAQPIRISTRVTNQYNNLTSTVDTVSEMNKIVRQAVGSDVLLSACYAAGALRSYSERVCAEAIWHWIKLTIKFVTDEQTMLAMGIPIEHPTKELLISPTTLLAMPNPQGDCDDFSMLAKAMLNTCGIKASFITIKADEKDPHVWSHIYVKAYFADGSSMPMDCSHGLWPGWETQEFWEKREWI
jgi:hypothetical protein